jgi:hypothetical protein
MGTSFVEYRGFGYWSRDSFIESWIGSVLEEIQKQSRVEPWLRTLADEWRIQSSIDGGCIYLGLDAYLSEEPQRKIVLQTAETALVHCPEIGRRTGELFIKLLSGELQTTSSDPIDYL